MNSSVGTYTSQAYTNEAKNMINESVCGEILTYLLCYWAWARRRRSVSVPRERIASSHCSPACSQHSHCDSRVSENWSLLRLIGRLRDLPSFASSARFKTNMTIRHHSYHCYCCSHSRWRCCSRHSRRCFASEAGASVHSYSPSLPLRGCSR